MIDTLIARPHKIHEPVHFQLACPHCRAEIRPEENVARCQTGHSFIKRAEIWRFLSASRAAEFTDFLREYRIVREAEGWASPRAEYYRQLPHVAADDPQKDIWKIRARNFTRLLALVPDSAPLKILDVGAGNGWLSNKLALRGHHVAALDLSDDARDGLGARMNYASRFECYQAEFDRLPFREAQFDLVVFNAALHYSESLATTLQEAARVLNPRGRIIVLDSPFYARESSGTAMLAEREAKFAKDFGFDRAVRNVGFLTESRMNSAANNARLQIKIDNDRWSKKLRRTWIKARTRRAPARFPLMVLQK